MRFQKIPTRAFGLSLALFCTAASHGQGLDDPPSLVTHFADYGDSSITDVSLRGSVRNIPYSIAAARTGIYIIFNISLRGRSTRLRVLREDFPEIDLRTIREGVNHESEPETLRFEVQYSQLGGCFGNGETPRRLLISFNVQGRVSASRLTAEGCQLSWRRVRLMQTGAGIYSASSRD